MENVWLSRVFDEELFIRCARARSFNLSSWNETQAGSFDASAAQITCSNLLLKLLRLNCSNEPCGNRLAPLIRFCFFLFDARCDARYDARIIILSLDFSIDIDQNWIP